MCKQKEKTIEQFRKEQLLAGDSALLISQTDAMANNPNRTWEVRLDSHVDKKEIDILRQVWPQMAFQSVYSQSCNHCCSLQ
jgi:hypothetical protein